MNVLIATPSPSGSTRGNQVTAERWAGFLREPGHRVWIAQTSGDPTSGGGGIEDAELDAAELLVALHARKSAAVVERFHRRHPGRPLAVVLTGTDFMDVRDGHPAALRSLELAHRLITLHLKAPEALPAGQRSKAVVIVQSSPAPRDLTAPLPDRFEICVSGHLRPVKDPFRTAEAVRLLPGESRILVTHVGAALEDGMAERARAEMASNRRYTWLGGVPHDEALRLMARSRLLVLTSRMEGGANVVCEALASSVPVISSRIDGSVGLLGEDYPGYFPVGDTAALADLLSAAERDEAFYRQLRARCEERRSLVDPARERQAWADLLTDIADKQGIPADLPGQSSP